MDVSAEIAQLWETTDNPAPEYVRTEFMRSFDGKRIRYAIFGAQSGHKDVENRGTILLLHGRNQSIEHYFELITYLNKLGFCVATLDWRGQGGSERLLKDPSRGHVRRFSDYNRDLKQFMQDIVLKECPAPYSIVAHSAGALVALKALQDFDHQIERVVLVTPLIRLAGGVRANNNLFRLISVLRWIGCGSFSVTKLFHRRKQVNLKDNPYTSDKIRYERRLGMLADHEHLSLGAPSYLWLYEALKTSREVSHRDFINKLTTPILLVAAGNDRIVSADAIELYARELRNGICVTIDGAKHDLIHEADFYRDQFLAALEAFIPGTSQTSSRQVENSVPKS